MTKQEVNRKTRLLEILAVTVIYVATARIGQIFSIEPGNITPVWIPSGIMLAWVILRGYYIWPGIFLGAFLGNIWAYFSATSNHGFFFTMFAGVSNGAGDSLFAIGSVMLMLKYLKRGDTFKSLSAFLGLLAFGVIIGPLVSALFGVTSLWLVGTVTSDNYWFSLLTWWVGGGIGVLLLTPLILSFFNTDSDTSLVFGTTELVIFFTAVIIFPLIMYSVGDNAFLRANGTNFIVPILLWSVIRFGLRISFSVTLYFTACLIWLELIGLGAFQYSDQYYRIASIQVFVLITVSSIFIVGSLLSDRNRSYRLLQEKNKYDSLTKIYNRQYFDQQLLREIDRQKRDKMSFSVIMFDIDFFKRVNDKYGHQIGDEALKKLTSLVAKHTRDIDTFARWGGEEFMVLMAETNVEGAVLFAELIRAEVERTQIIPHECITISLGVIEANSETDELTLFKRLDAALYLAKSNGRNQVRVAQEALNPSDLQ